MGLVIGSSQISRGGIRRVVTLSGDYVLQKEDNGTYFRYTGVEPIEVTVGNDFPEKGGVLFRQAGLGSITLVASGVTLNGATTLDDQHSTMALVKVSSGVFDIILYDESGADASVYVPYDGANADVDLGLFDLETTQVRTPEVKTDGVTPTDLKITTGAERTLELGTVVWDDMMVALGAVRQGSSAATWTPYKGSEVLAFAKNASNKIFFTIQYSHRIKTGTDTEFHIHTVAPDNNAGDVVWSLSVSYANIGGTFGGEAVTPHTQTIAVNSLDKHGIFVLKNPFTADAGISSIALCSLTRLGNDSGDDYDNNIYLVALDSHFQVDTLGSRLRTAK